MSDANKKQVGGEHYQKPIQHWDFITANKIGYLEGCATKYIVRHAEKNGRQDLLKAIHYIEKMLEVYYPEPKPADEVSAFRTVFHGTADEEPVAYTPDELTVDTEGEHILVLGQDVDGLTRLVKLDTGEAQLLSDALLRACDIVEKKMPEPGIATTQAPAKRAVHEPEDAGKLCALCRKIIASTGACDCG